MSTASSSRAIVTEKTYSCSDGVKLAARYWANFEGSPSQHTRKILCLHGWLDNAASFDRLAPILLDSLSPSSTAIAVTAHIPTEIVALDFPGHGLSGHKSVDGPPQLLAEYAYYVAELVEALQWGDGNASNSVPVSRTVVDNINSNSNSRNTSNTEGNSKQSTRSDSNNDVDINGTDKEGGNSKIILMGHSMGSGVSTVLCAAFPEWFSALVLLEGGIVARNAHDVSRHVRAACQRRLKSNRTLFPNANGSNNGSSTDGAAALPRAKVYSNLDSAIEARLSTTRRMPGDQFLSYEAARDMVMRATAPANLASSSAAASVGHDSVVFRHDPRLQWPSLIYYTREQVETFYSDVHMSNIPVCLLWAADGWPTDTWAEKMRNDVLKPIYSKRLSGSHHFHADPDTVNGVARDILLFMEEQEL
eukprot:CAMPEP_0181087406 /NCGR_PEP_ID=MMETSP1071-20121207/6254_1 /TAXON_ID=35127 /ORGANISM="Thalassiosira sp., Strain NH16" /LENGTH=418 /DNA_ID=CAMNT_0023169289 /DNA_START=71 /DNA_END=1327 /DNA_ORIENTATION=-